MKDVKDNLLSVLNYFIKEWLVFLIIFGIIALLFQDASLMAWGMLGRLLGIVFLDKSK